MATLKNIRQEEFCHAIAEGKNQTEAYIIAGYKKRGAKQSAHRLLTNADLQARIAEIKANIELIAAEKERKTEAKVGITKAWVIEELRKVHEKAQQQEPPKGSDSNKALELIGKELGMFRDRVSLENPDGEQFKILIDWGKHEGN
jgi:phage terminase small subunit